METAYKENTENASAEAFEPARKQMKRMEDKLTKGAELFDKDSDELEGWVKVEGRELLRLMLQGHYDLRAPAVPVEDVVDRADVPRTYTRSSMRRALTSFGEIHVPRVAFSTRGESNLHPLDADLNLSPRKASRHLQKRACELASDVSFERAHEHLHANTGQRIHKRQLEDIAVEVAQDFEGFYLAREVMHTETSDALILSVDGKGVVMHTGSLRPQTRANAEAKEPRKKGDRIGPGEKKDHKRMATVCAIYDHEPQPRSPDDILSEERIKAPKNSCKNKRVWADIRAPQRETIASLLHEANRRDPEQEREWVVLIDGQPTLRSQLEEVAQEAQVEVHFVIDIIHVIEYLWKAAHALYGSGSDSAKTWVGKQLRRLLQGQSNTVIHSAKVTAGKLQISTSRRTTVMECCDYIQERQDDMQYHVALAKGWPISTGVVEGTCRHLINDRLDITGARWHLDSAEAILRLRALISSGDWPEYWAWHKSMSYHRDHASKFYNDSPPKPVYPTLRQHLQVVS